MLRHLLFVLCALYLISYSPVIHINAMWDCDPNAIPGVAMIPGPPMIPAVPPQPRCVESSTATQFKTLRGCLRCEDDFTKPEQPDVGPPATICNIPLGGDPTNACKDDPRFVMRNFAALNYWSVGRMLSLAVPLSIAGGAVLCLIFMLYGAYTYITSGGEEKKITESTHTMTYAGLGLVLIIAAYVLVRTVLFVTKVNTFGF